MVEFESNLLFDLYCSNCKLFSECICDAGSCLCAPDIVDRYILEEFDKCFRAKEEKTNVVRTMTECNEERKAIDIFGNECSDYFGSGAYNCSDCWRYDYCIGSPDDDECRATFDEYRCKGCSHYDHCFYNEVAAEVESDNLYRAMQGEPLEKIFGGTYNVNETETITDGDVPF